MRAEELTERISIQERTETQDSDTGVMTDDWAVTHSRKPARVRQANSREVDRARAIDPRVTLTVVLRYWRDYLAELSARHRLIWHDGTNDRTLEIVGAPVETQRRQAILVPCSEVR